MATRTLQTPSILLVGHSVDEQEAYTRALHGLGYEVVSAATTVLAYRMATTTRDRLRDVSGWFCSDPACEYQELARANE